MIKVLLNGAKMTSRKSAHDYLKKQFNFPEYYGANLDAIWDILSTISEPITIELVNKEILVDALGAYGESLEELFSEVASENEYVVYVTECDECQK